MDAVTRDELLDWAVETGRIAAGSRDRWAQAYGDDPVWTRRNLRGRVAGAATVALASRGHAASPATRMAPSTPAAATAGGPSGPLRQPAATASTPATVGLPDDALREQWLDWAVASGRLVRDLRGAWARMYSVDPVGTARALCDLAPTEALASHPTSLMDSMAAAANRNPLEPGPGRRIERPRPSAGAPAMPSTSPVDESVSFVGQVFRRASLMDSGDTPAGGV